MYDHQNGTTAKLQLSTLLRKIPDSALYLPWFKSIFSHEEYLHYWGRNYSDYLIEKIHQDRYNNML